jgi:PAS domain S-box-containing protein
MNPSQLTFDYNDFNDIFPFYILMDNTLTILKTGQSLQKIIPDSTEIHFEKLFSIVRPYTPVINFDQIKLIHEQLIIIKFINRESITFRGQFKFLHNSKQVIFIGSPWFDDANKLIESGLQINDFPPHNPMIDFLHMLKTQEIANEDMRNAIEKINWQKKELLTAKNKLEELTTALEESNKRYEYVNKATSEAIWDWDIMTGEVFYGDGFNKLFGYDTSKLPMKFNIWEKRIHPEDHERITNSIDSFLISDLNNWSQEYRYLKADGSFAFVSDKAFIIRNEDGYAIRMIGSMQDITKIKEEEHHLRLMESVVSNTNDSVIITEIKNDYPIVYVNEAFTKMTGYNLHDVKGKNPRILQGPKTNKETLDKISNALKNWESSQATTINYKKNGNDFWVNFSISPIVNEKGEYTHWISVERDVTDSINANEELKNQKKFTDEILNNLPTDIAVFDPSHHYLFINQYAIKNKEIREWMIGKNDFDYTQLKGIDDGLARFRRAKFEECINNKEKTEWVDEHTSPDGSKNYKLRIFSPYFENNKLKFVVGYGVDITESKIAELKVIEAMESIKKSNSELEQFAYVASHDLQEPLRMITSFLTQLEKKYADALDEKAKEYIFYAVDGAKRMRHIILDLLEYSRVGKSNDKISAIDINEIISDFEVLHSKQIEELNAVIVKKNLPVLKNYKTPIRQLFQNIISNGLKYHRKDIKPEIVIEAVSLNDSWMFTISDNGIGIDKQYFSNIFEIFQRLHNKDEYSGTGIGLSISQKIIDKLGGKIWLESEIGKGSSFHFTIPFEPN